MCIDTGPSLFFLFATVASDTTTSQHNQLSGLLLVYSPMNERHFTFIQTSKASDVLLQLPLLYVLINLKKGDRISFFLANYSSKFIPFGPSYIAVFPG